MADPDLPPTQFVNSGKLFIIAMVGVSLLAAGGAWWHQYRQGQHALTFWGADGSYRIRHAAHAQLQRLAPAEAIEPTDAGNAPTVHWLQRTWIVRAERDVSTAPGFVHARQALIVDHQFIWDAAPPDVSTFTCDYVLRFTDEHHQSTELVFDLERGWAMDARHPEQWVRLGPMLQAGLRAFFHEQFADEPHEAATTSVR